MSIVVCIKQVPVDVKEEANCYGSIDREQGSYCINSADLYALEAALRMKEILNEKVIVVSMGTRRCIDSLKDAASLGADEMVLLNDVRFAGSDTQATSYILAKAIHKIGDVRIVFCGMQTVDGGTGQVGPQLAEKLSFNLATNIINFKIYNKEKIDYLRILNCGIVEGKISFPALFTINRLLGECRVATIKGILKANKMQPIIWDVDSLNLGKNKCGVLGSNTRVEKVYSVNRKRDKVVEICGDYSKIAEELVNMIIECKRKLEKNDYHINKSKCRSIIKRTLTIDEIEVSLENSEILIFAELENEKIEDSVLQLIGKMKTQLQKEEGCISVVMITAHIPSNIEKIFCYGASKAYIFDVDIRAVGNERFYSKCLERLILKINPSVALFVCTEFSRTVASWLASRIKVGLTADCIELMYDGKSKILKQIRPAFAGDKHVEIICKTRPQMATVRPNVFPLAEEYDCERGDIYILSDYSDRCIKQDIRLHDANMYDLSKSSIVLVGGRGLENSENFSKLNKIAELLGVDIGATRAAVDLGWSKYCYQIGLTGINLQSQLCILFGVSGASEHIAGLMNVKELVAVNNDCGAEIFCYSNIKVIADANKILEEMNRLVKKMEAEQWKI